MNDMSYTKKPIGMSVAFYVLAGISLLNQDLNCVENILQIIALICFATFLLFKPCAVGLPIAMGAYSLINIIGFWGMFEEGSKYREFLEQGNPNENLWPGIDIKVGTVSTIIAILMVFLVAIMIGLVVAFLAVLFKTLPNSTMSRSSLQKLAGTSAGLIIVPMVLIFIVIIAVGNEFMNKHGLAIDIKSVLCFISYCVAFWYLSADISCIPRMSFTFSQPQDTQYAEPQYQQPQYQQPQYQQPQQQPVNNQAGAVHKWRCECGNMISSTPCPFCGKGGAKTVDPQNENVVMVELESFKKLLDAGLITEEDYNRKKKELLGI